MGDEEHSVGSSYIQKTNKKSTTQVHISFYQTKNNRANFTSNKILKTAKKKLYIVCHIINFLLTSLVRAVWENIKPRSCCIDLAIARSIQQNLSLIFSHTALTLSQ